MKRDVPVWSHLPFPLLLLAAGTWAGYYGTDHEIGFELMILGPFLFGAALLLAAFSIVIVSWGLSKPWRIRVALLHLLLVLTAAGLLPFTRPLGKWIWEQRVLRPRVPALRQFAQDTLMAPVAIQGYPFAGIERTSEG